MSHVAQAIARSEMEPERLTIAIPERALQDGLTATPRSWPRSSSSA